MNKKIIKLIQREQKRQQILFGVQNHNQPTWLAIILGELGGASDQWTKKDKKTYKTELIHVAATAISALECFERNKK